MDITLGLDFGTHQSKLCMSYMPNNEQIYEFFEFIRPDGVKTLLFPSIIQINKDDTISVGFVDKDNCKANPTPAPAEPIFPLEPLTVHPPCPRKIYPEKPKEEKQDWKEQLAALSKGKSKYQELVDDWEKRCRGIDAKWEIENKKWLDTCNEIDEAHKSWQSRVDSMKRDYEYKLSAWKSHKEQLMYFRYFKLASFSNMFWDKSQNSIDANTLSVWYLTYLMLLVKKNVADKFNEVFEESVSIQMGIPSSFNTDLSKLQKKKACRLLIAARNLMELFSSAEDFCSHKYQDLLELTQIPDKDIEETAENYGFVVLPEAYAGLKSLTHRQRLRHGDLHLLVDIGGGTTDIAFFTVNEKLEPCIHRVESFHRGLNYVFENFCSDHPDYSISDAQELFSLDQQPFSSGVWSYKKELDTQLSRMIQHIINEFANTAREKGFEQSDLTDAMDRRPIVYCGGGSMYNNMRIQSRYFSDIRIVDKNMLSIPTLLNTDIDERLFTILATSYGLSIAMLGEIEMIDTATLFRQLDNKITEKRNRRWLGDHEYGLTDL